jgi:hypothetical protein
MVKTFEVVLASSSDEINKLVGKRKILLFLFMLSDTFFFWSKNSNRTYFKRLVNPIQKSLISRWPPPICIRYWIKFRANQMSKKLTQRIHHSYTAQHLYCPSNKSTKPLKEGDLHTSRNELLLSLGNNFDKDIVSWWTLNNSCMRLSNICCYTMLLNRSLYCESLYFVSYRVSYHICLKK